VRKLSRITRPYLLLLALSFCWLGPSRPATHPQPALAQPRLRFGQSLAMSDFDGDGRADLAILSETGQQKDIEICLSSTGTHSKLRFDSQTIGRGSLFAEDVDHDGATDLIWTDLLHPDDVIIWFGDGTGRFERICPHEYANLFVITGSAQVSSENQARDDGLTCSSNRLLDLAVGKQCGHRTGTSVPGFPVNCVQLRRGIRRQPSDRGPPDKTSV